MSKMDGLRAMREARYEKSATRAQQGSAPRKRTPAATGPTTGHTTGHTLPSAEAPVEAEELCGHRAISGRTCTREQGHAAKSHRYS